MTFILQEEHAIIFFYGYFSQWIPIWKMVKFCIFPDGLGSELQEFILWVFLMLVAVEFTAILFV